MYFKKKVSNFLNKNQLWDFITMLVRFKPNNLVLALFLTVFIGLTEGIGLLLLIPLLQLIGLNVQQGALGQIAGFISSFFIYIGLKPTLTAVLVIYVFIIALNAFFYRLQAMKTSEIQYKFSAHLRKQLFAAITNSNWLFFTQKRSSDFAHALTYEIERINNGTSQFLSLIGSIIILLVYIIFAFKISGIITIIIFLIGIILLLLLKKRAKSSNVIGEKLSKSSKNMYSSTIRQMDGMKTIKSFNMEENNIELFKKVTDNVAMRYIDAIKSYADVKFLFDIGSVIILSIMVFILIEIMSIPTAELLILLFLFVRMIPRFSIIQRSYQNFINILPSFTTFMNLKKSCNDAVELKPKTDKIHLNDEIMLKNVSFAYNNSIFSIQDLNIKIKARKTTAIVGPSGAGKSTIIDMIMGFIKPVSGQVLIDKIPVSSENLHSWRDKIGYVAQDTFLFNDTIHNNLLLANPDSTEEDIIEALKLASAQEFTFKLPQGIDTEVGDRGVLLSGGEKQRLALARALLRKPSILILDEATSNLDSENEMKILDSIEKLHGDITILIIAHRLSTIQNADVIYLIESGSLVESGTWNELISLKSKFRAIYDYQSIFK